MLPFQIGNWKIDNDGITWISEPREYFIPRDRVTENGGSPRNNMYDWLVHMPEKTWLARQDIYALNTALIYAIEAYGLTFPHDRSFIQTFREQERELAGK